MLILGIESSCDETALSVSRDGREILSNCVLSQIDMHTIYGGVVPEIASRKHIEAITGLADEAIKQAGITKADLDAIAVTYAPGLIGALLNIDRVNERGDIVGRSLVGVLRVLRVVGSVVLLAAAGGKGQYHHGGKRHG